MYSGCLNGEFEVNNILQDEFLFEKAGSVPIEKSPLEWKEHEICVYIHICVYSSCMTFDGTDSDAHPPTLHMPS